MLTPAKTWEANGDYSRAIDAYLKMTVMQTTDYALLEEVCRLLGMMTLQVYFKLFLLISQQSHMTTSNDAVFFFRFGTKLWN